MDGATQSNTASPASQADSAEVRQQQIWNWFGKTLPQSFFESLKRDLEIVENSCIFTLPVTIWLMILQRLSQKGTLATAVAALIHGNGRELPEPCKKVLEDSISSSTGAYSQARQRVPVEAVRRVAEHTLARLLEISSPTELRDRLFVPDGSSIRLSNTPALTRVYPPAENRHGPSHWPVMKVAVMHHVITGLAMAPCFGLMYGTAAAWRAQNCGHQVMVRLTEARARRLSGGELTLDSDKEVLWEPSRDGRRNHPELPPKACIGGRLIVALPPGAQQTLWLFTTLEEPTEQIVPLYKERWNIGVSSQGHIVQSVRDRPGSKGSDPVAGEASWRESKTAKPSDKHTRKGVCATHRVATYSERRRSLVTRISGG